MRKKIPVVAIPLRFKDLAAGFRSLSRRRDCLQEFEAGLADYLGAEHCRCVGSGKAAFYVILKCLSSLSDKKEVILPAYTDAGLILVIQSLGLKPVLCDISADTFNLNPELVSGVISEQTLCIVAVHMFGLACEIAAIREIATRKNIFVVEDFAQAFGTTIARKMAGTLAEIGFSSFNRGKNLPTYSGGCISTGSKDLAAIMRKEAAALKQPNIFFQLSFIFKLAGLSLAVKPNIYGLFYPLIAHFKSERVPVDFSLLKYTDFQAAAGLSLLTRIREFSEKRYVNGLTLMDGLKDIAEIRLPKILPGSIPAFNRLPLIFKDIGLRERVHYRLLQDGIESSYMYPGALHQVFALGYKEGAFPNARYFAEHLLTVPVHPAVNQEDLLRIIEAIKATGDK